MKLKHTLRNSNLRKHTLEGFGFEFRTEENQTARVAWVLREGMSHEELASLLERLAESMRKKEFIVGHNRLTTKEINFDELTKQQQALYLQGTQI